MRDCGIQGSAMQVMLAREDLFRNTLNINVIYTEKCGQSLTCLSLPKRFGLDGVLTLGLDGLRLDGRWCTSSLRVNTPGSPTDPHKGKKA